jgi:hypothetical protein
MKKIIGEDGKTYYIKNGNPFRGCLFAVLIFFAFIIIGGIATTFMYTQSMKAVQKQVSGVSNESEYISLEEYNAVEIGMSYEEVTKIIGSKGTISSEAGEGEYKTFLVIWYGSGSAGSNTNITFQNNKVMAKAQFGLK